MGLLVLSHRSTDRRRSKKSMKALRVQSPQDFASNASRSPLRWMRANQMDILASYSSATHYVVGGLWTRAVLYAKWAPYEVTNTKVQPEANCMCVSACSEAVTGTARDRGEGKPAEFQSKISTHIFAESEWNTGQGDQRGERNEG